MKLRTLHTKQIVSWTPHEYCQACDGVKLGKLKAGDTVALICKVIDTKTWLEKGRSHSQANFHIIETCKISGFLD